MKTVAARLRHARESAGLTQRQVAEAAQLKSPSHVCQIEQGDDPEAAGAIKSPSADVLARLAKALNVRAEWLAFGSGPMRQRAGRAA